MMKGVVFFVLRVAASCCWASGTGQALPVMGCH